MNKEEFLEGLRTALRGRGNDALIEENLRFYRDYIDIQMHQGKREEEVIEELGDPRLLAKSISEAHKHAGANEVYEEVEEDSKREDNTGRYRAMRLPGWLFGLLILLVIMAVFGFIVTMVSWLAPILIPLLLIGFAIKMIRTLGR